MSLAGQDLTAPRAAAGAGGAPDLFAEPQRIRATRRSIEIGRLYAYYCGKQYDGRPDWFTGRTGAGEIVPLRERKPCVIYPLPRAVCNQATRFTFGEGRYPTVGVAATEEEGEAADELVNPDLAVTEEEAKALTRYIAHVTECARLKSTMRTLLRHGLSQRTAVACLSVRRGQFTIDLPRAQDCYAEFQDGDPDGEVLRLVWCYPFDKEVVDPVNGRITTKTHFFRRDYTAEEVVFYEDAPLEPGKPIAWTRDDARSTPHNLGFCPVIWTRNLADQHCQDIDGISLYEGLEDELDALNLALSQRHRGIVYFGTPQAWEAGVGADEQPGEVARTQRPARKAGENAKSTDPYQPEAGEAARKTGPGSVWSYRNEKATAGLVETTGKAFEAASKHVLDIRARLLEAMDVVLLDPSEIAGKGELSAKALALLFAPLLALVDELRECWWTHGLAKILSMVLRITAVLGGKGVLVPGAGKVADICQRFFLEVEGTDGARSKVWIGPKMIPSWGSYFSPTNQEIGELVLATVQAQQGGLIGKATAKRNVASCFGEVDTDDDEDEEAHAAPASSGADDDDMDALHMDVHDDARRLLLPSKMMARLRVRKLGELGGLDVWAVDGNTVRLVDIDFTDGGNCARYVYIPEGELWIEERVAEKSAADFAASAVHEAVEAAVMLEGIPYESAHAAACAVERVLRTAFGNGVEEASTPAEALSVAARWLPGLTDGAMGLAKAHAARKPSPMLAGAEIEDGGPASERGEKPGDPDPDSQRPGQKPRSGPTPGGPKAPKA